MTTVQDYEFTTSVRHVLHRGLTGCTQPRGGRVRAMMGGRGHTHFADITGKALTAVGLCPTPETVLKRMLAAQEAIAENAEAPQDERTRARKVLDGLSGARRQVA